MTNSLWIVLSAWKLRVQPRKWNTVDAEVNHDIEQCKRWTNSPSIIAQFEQHWGARATKLNVQFQRRTAATAQQLWRRNDKIDSFPHSGANVNVQRQFKSIEEERTCFAWNSSMGDMLKTSKITREFFLSPSIDNGKSLKANAPLFGHNLANYAAFIGDIVFLAWLCQSDLSKWRTERTRRAKAQPTVSLSSERVILFQCVVCTTSIMLFGLKSANSAKCNVVATFWLNVSFGRLLACLLARAYHIYTVHVSNKHTPSTNSERRCLDGSKQQPFRFVHSVNYQTSYWKGVVEDRAAHSVFQLSLSDCVEFFQKGKMQTATSK